MVRKDRCCVGIYNNDRRYPHKLEIKSHVQILKGTNFQKTKPNVNGGKHWLIKERKTL